MDLNFTLFQIGFLPVGIIDILDILLVAYILYKTYYIMFRTRAVQMFIGLLIILLVSMITHALNMRGMSWIFDSLKTVWLLAFVILFQPELRRVLSLMGQSRLIRFFTKEQRNLVVSEIVRGTVELSRRGYGGLIVLVRDIGLKSIAETGIKIQSVVSSALIVSIFNPRSPLHDGAVIIQSDIIEAAKCILPLSKNANLEYKYGTRHRAAIGMTEESDALVIVVSEESGTISLVESGEMVRGLDYDTLHDAITEGLRRSAKR
ncbi:diadenylate cyclase CdaA [bacterium]|nr:diadenylate cyclase CdaA [bacterium]